MRRKPVSVRAAAHVDGANIRVVGKIAKPKVASFFAGKDFDSAYFGNFHLIDAEMAVAIQQSSSIQSIEVWSGITRAGLSRLMQIANLKTVHVFQFTAPGKLSGFDRAANVETFRCSFDLRTSDILEIAKLPRLHSLGAQDGKFGLRAVERLSQVETLRLVDFEAVRFSDEMAAGLAKSKSITDVIVPATRLSKKGLAAVSQISQMTYLDIWANDLDAADLDCLAGHPNLQKIELGGFVGNFRQLKARDLIPKLEKMPALKTVHFEDVLTTEEEAAFLHSRYTFRLLNE